MGTKFYWTLVVAIIVVTTTRETYGCTCWDGLNSTMREAVSSKPLPEDIPAYTYLGIMVTATGKEETCLCSDVLRMEATLDIESEALYNSTKENETYVILKNVTDTIKSIIDQHLKNELVLIKVTQNDTEELPSPKTQWILDLTLKGRYTAATRVSQIENWLKGEASDNGDGTVDFAMLTEVKESDIKFTALTCKTEPLSAPGNGTRNWTVALNYPGAKASYSCKTGFFLASGKKTDSLTCLHSDLLWTTPPVPIACKKGCNDDPPKAPFFVTRVWKPTMRSNGDVASYVCNNGFRSKVPNTYPNATSKCEGSAWTSLPKSFECEQILCPVTIPQVPAFSYSDWNGVSMFIGTRISYGCIDGYKSTKTGKVEVVCLANGTWENLPKNFRCINKAYAPVDDAYRAYDFYEDSGITVEKKTEKNMFLLYTVPSMLGLIILIFCCLCCCRIDSPIFYVCTRNARKTRYYLDKSIPY